MNSNHFLAAALSYADRNWPVFPLHNPNGQGGCSCRKNDCQSIGKHPRTKNGFKEATTNSSAIKRWWKRWPDANVGIVTGETSGLMILDVDPRSDGDDSLFELEQQHGKLPDTVEALTGGGGRHILFAYPKEPVKSKVGIAPGLDVKAVGGYIVAPPSLHASGKPYEWEVNSHPDDVALASCPKWLIDKLKEPEHKDSNPSENKVDPAAILAGVPEGQRDNRLFQYACRLRAKNITKEEAKTLVLQAAAHCSPPFPEQEALRKIDSAWKYAPGKAKMEARKLEPPRGLTAAELLAKEFADPVWAVPNILPEGLSLLCGKPKIGKSWKALNLAIAIALGGTALSSVRVERGEVIYLALEDSERRLKKRISIVLQGEPAPDNLHLFTRWSRLDQGGLLHLKNWVKEHPDTRLVIVDTLQRVRQRQKGKSNPYGEDYEALEGLKALADKHSLAVLVIHHLRKAGADDVLDLVSGTTGLTGAADTILILQRGRGRADAVLKITGRDVEETELALKFNKESCCWQLLGNAEDYQRSQQRQDIMNILLNSEEPLSPKEIAEKISKK